MTIPVTCPDTAAQTAPATEGGFGALRTERGNLPLRAVDVRAAITGTAAGVDLTQTFHNPFDVTLEATYVFPLPDRAAVTAMRMTAAGRTIDAQLAERAQARRTYTDALAAGHRAAIAEEERPDVFTLRVGNIAPGERVTVETRLAQPLAVEESEATFRFPFVVAPRYIPGEPLDGAPTGSGTAEDTDAVPDASRISPPVLLPGFPNPVALSMAVSVDPAGLPVRELTSSLHLVEEAAGGHDRGESETTELRLRSGERLDRDFVLRFALAPDGAFGTAAHLTPDPQSDGESAAGGTFTCVVAPPRDAAPPQPRDFVVLLDRSGSMRGWKMVAARRAAARIVDTLTDADNFAVLCFDDRVESPPDAPEGLAPGSDRNRFRAVTHLAGTEARGGTRLLAPVRRAAELLGSDTPGREPVLVLVTDGQVGDEDRILAELADRAPGVRIHTVGIDRAVNAGFLNRLAFQGQGRCELVESEDRLDAAMEAIHRRIGAPVLTDVAVAAEGLGIPAETVVPASGASVFPGAPLTVRGRYHRPASGEGSASGTRIVLRGLTPEGDPWQREVEPTASSDPAARALWARARLRDLEDRYVSGRAASGMRPEELERAIVDLSLRFGVLCRFTAFVAVDSRTSAAGAPGHGVIQPVELPQGWELAAEGAPVMGWAGGPVPAAPPAPGGMAIGATAGSFERAPEPKPYPRTPPGPNEPYPAAPGPRFSSARAEEAEQAAADIIRRHDKLWTPRKSRSAARSPVPADTAAAVRAELGAEARRMRAMAEAVTPWQRRVYLADLGSRLAVHLGRLAAAGAAENERAELGRLVEKLHTCAEPSGPRGTEVDTLWTQALEILERIGGS